MTPRILVAGIGNIFLGDDGFGVEVVRRLAQEKIPEDVRVVDFGIRGFDLAYALMEPYGAVILVDALPRGSPPGTLHTIEPDLSSLESAGSHEMTPDTHGMNPMRVLAMVNALGGQPKRLFVVGCEPERLAPDEEEERMGLSAPVGLAVDAAVAMIQSLIGKLAAERQAVAAI